MPCKWTPSTVFLSPTGTASSHCPYMPMGPASGVGFTRFRPQFSLEGISGRFIRKKILRLMIEELIEYCERMAVEETDPAWKSPEVYS